MPKGRDETVQGQQGESNNSRRRRRRRVELRRSNVVIKQTDTHTGGGEKDRCVSLSYCW